MQVDLVTKTDKLDSDEEKLGQEEYHTYEDVEYESFEDRWEFWFCILNLIVCTVQTNMVIYVGVNGVKKNYFVLE